MSRKNFYGDDSIKARVTGFVNFSHAARADGRDDFVGAEFRASSNAQFFNPAVQLRTTVIGEGAAPFCCGAELIRNFWPSADTPYS